MGLRRRHGGLLSICREGGAERGGALCVLSSIVCRTELICQTNQIKAIKGQGITSKTAEKLHFSQLFLFSTAGLSQSN